MGEGGSYLWAPANDYFCTFISEQNHTLKYGAAWMTSLSTFLTKYLPGNSLFMRGALIFHTRSLK